MHKIIIASAIATVLLAGQANAGLTVNGDVVTDSATNLDWLKLTSSTGLSYNEVILKLSDSSSAFYGYQYATLAQVETLFQGQGYVGDFHTVSSDVSTRVAASTMMANFGQTGTNCCARGDGMYANSNGGKVDWLFYLPVWPYGGAVVRALDNWIDPDIPYWNDPGENQIGSWLVKAGGAAVTSPVPEPASYARLLIGLGLIGAAATRRKANQA